MSKKIKIKELSKKYKRKQHDNNYGVMYDFIRGNKTKKKKTVVKRKKILKSKTRKSKVLKKKIGLPSLEKMVALKWITTRNTGRKWIKFNLDFVKYPELFTYWKKVLASEDIAGAMVQLEIFIRNEDLAKFDVDKARQICKEAFYVKPIVPRISFWTEDDKADDDDKKQISDIFISPFQYVCQIVKVRKPINRVLALNIAKEIMEGYIPNFKGFVKQIDVKNSRSFDYEFVARKKKKLKIK